MGTLSSEAIIKFFFKIFCESTLNIRIYSPRSKSFPLFNPVALRKAKTGVLAFLSAIGLIADLI